MFSNKFIAVPTISMFYGIIIRMYYAPKEHNPPHIHAYFQNSTVTINIDDGEIITGKMNSKQIRLIQAWVEIHKEELQANWNLCQEGDRPFKIEPLK